MSNKAKFWIGVVVALPAMIVAGIISGAGSAVVDAVGGDPAVGAAVSGAIGLALLGGFVTMIILERTRWIAVKYVSSTLRKRWIMSSQTASRLISPETSGSPQGTLARPGGAR